MLGGRRPGAARRAAWRGQGLSLVLGLACAAGRASGARVLLPAAHHEQDAATAAAAASPLASVRGGRDGEARLVFTLVREGDIVRVDADASSVERGCTALLGRRHASDCRDSRVAAGRKAWVVAKDPRDQSVQIRFVHSGLSEAAAWVAPRSLYRAEAVLASLDVSGPCGLTVDPVGLVTEARGTSASGRLIGWFVHRIGNRQYTARRLAELESSGEKYTLTFADVELGMARCQDTPGWQDARSGGCSVYAERKFCKRDGTPDVGWRTCSEYNPFCKGYQIEDFAVGGVSAYGACCVCGGGWDPSMPNATSTPAAATTTTSTAAERIATAASSSDEATADLHQPIAEEVAPAINDATTAAAQLATTAEPTATTTATPAAAASAAPAATGGVVAGADTATTKGLQEDLLDSVSVTTVELEPPPAAASAPAPPAEPAATPAPAPAPAPAPGGARPPTTVGELPAVDGGPAGAPPAPGAAGPAPAAPTAAGEQAEADAAEEEALAPGGAEATTVRPPATAGELPAAEDGAGGAPALGTAGPALVAPTADGQTEADTAVEDGGLAPTSTEPAAALTAEVHAHDPELSAPAPSVDPQAPHPSPSPPRGRDADPLKSHSPARHEVEGGHVELRLTVQNVAYAALTARPRLRSAFLLALKKAIAHQAGHGLHADNVAVFLSAGSVVAEVAITPPAGVPAELIARSLEAGAGELESAARAGLEGVPGIDQVSEGAISVTVGSPEVVLPPAEAAKQPAPHGPSKDAEPERASRTRWAVATVILVLLVSCLLAWRSALGATVRGRLALPTQIDEGHPDTGEAAEDIFWSDSFNVRRGSTIRGSVRDEEAARVVATFRHSL